MSTLYSSFKGATRCHHQTIKSGLRTKRPCSRLSKRKSISKLAKEAQQKADAARTQGEIDADIAMANAARIEAENKKRAANASTDELRSAAHDAEIRASNERALKSLPPKTDPPKTDDGVGDTR
jgi:hypothetical protein